MNKWEGMTESEALSEVVKLRKEQDKLIGAKDSLTARDLIVVAKLIRENSERIRSIQEKHFQTRPVVTFREITADEKNQAGEEQNLTAEEPKPTELELAMERERDVLKEVIRLLEAALERTDEPRLYARLATERKKMVDCQQDAAPASGGVAIIEIVRHSEQK
jgi:hypothetical protein